MVSHPLPPSTHFVSINGATLHYASAGDPSSTPFLVLHGGRGFGDHRADFNTFLPMSESHHLVGIDMVSFSSGEKPRQD